MTCNILLVSQCFCVVALQSDSLNFRCVWLSGRGVVAKKLLLVSSSTEIWRLTGICEEERALSMTASVCRSKRLG